MKLRRRSFSFFAALSPAAGLVAPQSARAEDVVIDTLRTAARDLFPHDSVPTSRYGEIAETFLVGAVTQAERLTNALADAVPTRDYQTTPEPARATALRGIQASPDFQMFRMHVLMQLYSDQTLVGRFGYEGPSLEKGGYLERGFDDLRWLPEPDSNAD